VEARVEREARSSGVQGFEREWLVRRPEPEWILVSEEVRRMMMELMPANLRRHAVEPS
jgi:hypothetical protein